MFDKFTDRARVVLLQAGEEAERLGHECIGTEHILFGIVDEGMGIAARILGNLGIHARRVRGESEKFIHHVMLPTRARPIPFTPCAKRLLLHAQEEAIELGHDYIGTEHILLGLLREDECVAVQVLVNLGLTVPEIRKKVLDIFGVDVPQAEGA